MQNIFQRSLLFFLIGQLFHRLTFWLFKRTDLLEEKPSDHPTYKLIKFEITLVLSDI
jgi:hypothetical protein